ncbi:MAG: hypothetical protein JST15_10800 [Bacteroidetes bacterium]|nr:hypothetical protein [Bacteroidota bacterium]
MKKQETSKEKLTSKKQTGKRITSVQKTPKAKLQAKRQNQNHAAEISKIYKKLKAVCIRLYKADKENQRLVCIILRGGQRREKWRQGRIRGK